VTTSQGTFRPTSLYSYDNYNNVLAYCDPVETHTLGKDWIGNPGSSDALCPTGAGATGASQYAWTSTSSEIYGELSATYTPLGYHYAYSYNTGAQGGDYGLPTDIVGDAIAQLDGTTLAPQQHFTYDSYGDIATYNNGYGNWSLSYDALNRQTSATDPDGVTSRTCYFADDTVSARQSAYQYALDGNTVCGAHSVSYTYDLDEQETTETHHYGQTPSNGVGAGITQKWYDGGDRLIEVQLPSDQYTDNSIPWRTRYIYDLSQGGTVQIVGTNQSPSFSAHGSLYKTQNYFNSAWNDVNGNAFDALDRSVARYQYSPGNGLQKWTSTYDANGYAGLLTSKADPLGVTTSLTYDALEREASIAFTNDPASTPSRTYVYDPDGRTASITSSVFGTDGFTYDADGRQTQYQEGNGGGVTSPATLTYAYYANGLRSALSVSSSALTQSNEFTYDYRMMACAQN